MIPDILGGSRMMPAGAGQPPPCLTSVVSGAVAMEQWTGLLQCNPGGCFIIVLVFHTETNRLVCTTTTSQY